LLAFLGLVALVRAGIIPKFTFQRSGTWHGPCGGALPHHSSGNPNALSRAHLLRFSQATAADVDVRSLKMNLMQKLRSQMWQKLADKEAKLNEVQNTHAPTTQLAPPQHGCSS